MLDHKTLEATLIAAAELEGFRLSAHDRMIIRNKVASTLSGKERHRQRMNAPEYEWKKPESPRR